MSVIERKMFPSYVFGPFLLNGTERLLLHGDEVVTLTPKVLETLFVLVENHGRVLTKAVLMEALWPDAFVEESSLVQSISLLRKALGNGPADQVYIETISKRGYRFVAQVRELNGDPAETQSPRAAPATNPERLEAGEPLSSPRYTAVKSWRRWQTLAAVVCVVAVSLSMFYWWRVRAAQRQRSFDLRSVAVVPFKTVGAEGEAELLALGMADSVILKLTRLEHISVLPTSSVFKYLGAEKDALTIGRELGVDAVLDGTVQRSGDRVRVTAQLITLKDKKTIWSGTFDEEYRSIFCLQDSVSELFADEVRLQVLNLRAKSQARPITRDAEAYQAYLMGLYFWNRRTAENLPKAIEYLQQAVDRDSSFATAYALLADSYHVYGGLMKSDKEAIGTARQKAEAAATRAIQLDETIAEAHIVLGGLLADKGDGDGASKEYRRALLLNPNNATAHVRYAYFLFVRLELDNAVREARQAQQLDPASAITNAGLGYMLMMNRQFEESIPYLHRSLELNPEATSSRINLGLAQLHCGRYNEALAEFSTLASQDAISSQMNRALTYAKLGRRNEVHKLIGEVSRSPGRDQVSNYDLATIYVALGETERAFQILRRSSFSWLEKGQLRFDPELDNVRSEPRFEAIFRKQYVVQDATGPNPKSRAGV
jgi:DNA-binding winged helix-turn-helix (wHTH) protein/TolB-like protein/Tfp pilus assembly protein PilF